MTTFSLPGTTTTSDPDREFWRGVLLAGGSTAIPRWTHTPVASVGQHAGAIPADLVAALRRLADGMGVPLSSVLLAVHAKVLAALSGEREIMTGYVARPGGQADSQQGGQPGERPLPCRLATGAGSWRELLLDTCRAESQLLAHQHFGVGDLRRELGLTGRPPETVFDPAEGASGGELDTGTVLGVGIAQYAGRLVLRLRYRADVIDADSAARIFGYYRTALELITADPDARHGR
jgi:non-ribosomal peptide synthetase component F